MKACDGSILNSWFLNSFLELCTVVLFKAKTIFIFFFIFFYQLSFSQQDSTTSIDLADLTIEELMQIKVITAAGKEESILDAAASIIVISANDIRKRGYTDLTEVLYDLPGFDIITTGGIAGGAVVYQRGYRTPLTQRTLIMINGVVDNNLYTHGASLGKQYPLFNIEQIEVIYGPTSALYGANAFLGIINIITKDGSKTEPNSEQITVSAQAGTFNTKSMELAARGKKSDFFYSVSGKYYRSDEADLSSKWGFLSNSQYGDTATWGPLLQYSHNGKKYGSYYSPSDDYGLIANVGFKTTKIGLINWKCKDGYGTIYSADRAQNNAFWKKSSLQLYLQNETQKEKFGLTSLLLYRKNQIGGDWAEAEPDWHPGKEKYSYISITQWNAIANSWLLKEDASYELHKNISLQSGFKYERKELTKAFDIPGYWGAFSSSVPNSNTGPYGLGAAIGHSRDSSYTVVEGPNPSMPSDNLFLTDDIGGYLQLIVNIRNLRFNVGIRHDYNSIYGDNTNIRASSIYKFNRKGVLNLIYSEAYQEPPPRQLFGGWNGGLANINLKPEKAHNIELVGTYGGSILKITTSVYYSHYRNVIKEEAENAGTRNIYGAEIKTLYNVKNFIPKSSNITAYLYYTYTQAYSSIHYNHSLGKWEDGQTLLGDIAPHKINLGFNLPILNSLDLNLRGNYVSPRLVYTRNALRPKNYMVADYFLLDGTVSYHFKAATLSFKARNILNLNYYQPGVEQADSGNDFSKRSLGYRNSLLPQAGRTLMLVLNVDL